MHGDIERLQGVFMKVKIRSIAPLPFFFSFLFFLLVHGILPAQVIEKTVPNYVLIDTDTGIGVKNQILQVYRFDSGQLLHVGQVRIVEFRNGKTAARILEVFPGFRITPGDFISRKTLDAVDIRGLKPSKPLAAKTQEKSYVPPKPAASSPAPDKTAAQAVTPKQPRETAANTQAAADLKPAANALPTEKSSKTAYGDITGKREPEPRGPVFQIGLYGGPYVSATRSTVEGTSPSFGAALRFFGAGRHALLVNYSATVLRGIQGNAGESRIVSTADVLFHAGVGWFIHYDIGAGFVYDQKAAISLCLGFSLDLPVFHVLTFSPNMRMYLYPRNQSWEGHILLGMNLYYTLF